MAEMGNMLKRCSVKPMVLDCALDYDGQYFYAREEIDHKVDLDNRHKLYADPETGEIKQIRGTNG